jgi:hypothetical protein
MEPIIRVRQTGGWHSLGPSANAGSFRSMSGQVGLKRGASKFFQTRVGAAGAVFPVGDGAFPPASAEASRKKPVFGETVSARPCLSPYSRAGGGRVSREGVNGGHRTEGHGESRLTRVKSGVRHDQVLRAIPHDEASLDKGARSRRRLRPRRFTHHHKGAPPRAPSAHRRKEGERDPACFLYDHLASLVAFARVKNV